MLALDPKVLTPLWATAASLIPPRPPDRHPLGCHRPRVSDETCFYGIVVRLCSGASWEDAARLVKVGETTLRRRRTEWLRAGVFTQLAELALSAYDTVVGLRLDRVVIDTSLHKAPTGGSGSGPSRVDRAKLGWKWSLATDAAGIPIGWVAAASNVHDQRLVEDTLAVLDAHGYELEIEHVYLDRGYDAVWIREMLAESGITGHIAHRAPKLHGRKAGSRARHPIPLGPRWVVERTNAWLSSFGQLRRNTDRHIIHREAAIDLAVALIMTIKLVKWHQRYGNTIYR